MKLDDLTTPRFLLAAAICIGVVCGANLSLADDDPQSSRRPFAVLTIAGIDRVLDDLEFVLESAGQTDRMSHIRNVLLYLNELDGIDRDRPFGLLFYLPTTPPFDAQAVAFLPVSGLDRLEDTLQRTGKLSLERVPDSNRFRFDTPEKTQDGLLVDDWIFLTEVASLLSEDLVEHLVAVPEDYESHDAVLTLHREGLPDVVLDEALRKMHADLERDLEPREGESNTEHRFRSRVSRGIVRLIERFLTETEGVAIGLDVSESDEKVRLDVRLNVMEESPLARMLGNLARPESQFSATARETAPLTVATTWRLDGEPAGIAGELLARVRGDVAGAIERPREQLGPHPFERILTSLSETINAGRLDSLVQFIDAPDGKFVLVAAVHVVEADSVGIAIREILRHHAQTTPDALVEVNALEIDGVALHRIQGKDVRRQDRRLYGENVALFVGAGRDAVWLAMGDTHTEDALRRVIPGPPAGSSASGAALPLLKATVHLSHWIALAGDGETERERKLAEVARLVFQNPDDDGVDLELFADKTGLRLNVRADRGYIRLLGVLLGSRIPHSR